MQSNFLLGTLRITEGARMNLKRIPYDLIARHAINEHGALMHQETLNNELAMKTLGRIISRYCINPTDLKLGNVLIITHATWDETIIQLEDE